MVFMIKFKLLQICFVQQGANRWPYLSDLSLPSNPYPAILNFFSLPRPTTSKWTKICHQIFTILMFKHISFLISVIWSTY